MSGPPAWLRGRLERTWERLDGPPDPVSAVRAVARRHDRDEADVLLTAGASEALLLLERVLQPQRAVAVHPHHPAFPQAERLLQPYDLDPAQVPADADLVLVGSPMPSGRLPQRLPELCRSGRTVVVDEAYGDAAPGSFAGRADLPGLVVVRSLSRTWGLAGLRAGYLVGACALVAELRAAQQPWPVSTLALTALETCSARGPVRAAEKAAQEGRERLAHALAGLGLDVVPGSQAPYLLCAGVPAVRNGVPCGVRSFDGHWHVELPEDLDRLVGEMQQVLAGKDS